MYENFAKLLEEYGVKASDVVKATGITSTVFSEWKRGKSTPKPDKLQKVADYFGVSLEYLTSGNDMLCNFKLQMPIARNIKKFREEKNIPVEELAEKLHVHPFTVIKIERGSLIPSNRILNEMGKVLEVPVEKFWENDEIIFPQKYVEIEELIKEKKFFSDDIANLNEKECSELIECMFRKIPCNEKIEWYKEYLDKKILKTILD